MRVYIFLFGLLANGVAVAQTCPTEPERSTPDDVFECGNGDITWHACSPLQTDDWQVRDKRTGLIWLRCSLGMTYDLVEGCSGTANTFNWQQALLSPGPTYYWRLPNIKELMSIAETSCHSPAINLTVFPKTPSDNFWSSSPGGTAADAWTINITHGRIETHTKTTFYSIRLVRGGQ